MSAFGSTLKAEHGQSKNMATRGNMPCATPAGKKGKPHEKVLSSVFSASFRQEEARLSADSAGDSPHTAVRVGGSSVAEDHHSCHYSARVVAERRNGMIFVQRYILCPHCGHRNVPARSPRASIKMILLGRVGSCKKCGKVLRLRPGALRETALVKSVREEIRLELANRKKSR